MYLTTLLFLVIIVNQYQAGAENKFMNTVRNLTHSNNGTKQNDDGVRKKLEKYLGECRGEGDEDYSASSEYSNPRGFRRGPDGATYPSSYGNRHQQQSRSSRSKNENGGGDRHLTNFRTDNECENKDYSQRSYNGAENHHFPENNYEPNNNHNNENRYNAREDFDRVNRGFPDRFPRWKREFNDKCVSQCVFSYLELLDENRSPSESAFVQFLQDNIENDKERIKIVREARRCFAKFVTTEEEDGCEFSKSLSKCLHLNID